MDLVRWDPFKELEDMSARLNRFVGGPARRTPASGELATFADWAPSVDIAETNEEYVIKAELPEIRKEDVKVTVEKGVLRLSGERKQEKEEKGKKYHRIERSYGSFLRSFILPENVDESKVLAEVKDGLLTVHLPKNEKAKPKAVDIKIG